MLNKKKEFSSEEDFFRALGAIKPCDLRDEQTSMKDAISFCVNVLRCFQRTGYMVPDKEKTELYLYRLGACRTDKAASKFVDKDKTTVGEVLIKDNIQFPLMAFDQVFLCETQESLRYSWERLTGFGYENSWVAEWIEKNEKTKDIEKSTEEPERIDETAQEPERIEPYYIEEESRTY